jgi:hypothetical protein
MRGTAAHDIRYRTCLSSEQAAVRPSANVGMFFGTKSGGTTLDQDEFGGNPFATALTELAGQPKVSLRNLPARLRKLTSART